MSNADDLDEYPEFFECVKNATNGQNTTNLDAIYQNVQAKIEIFLATNESSPD